MLPPQIPSLWLGIFSCSGKGSSFTPKLNQAFRRELFPLRSRNTKHIPRHAVWMCFPLHYCALCSTNQTHPGQPEWFGWFLSRAPVSPGRFFNPSGGRRIEPSPSFQHELPRISLPAGHAAVLLRVTNLSSTMPRMMSRIPTPLLKDSEWKRNRSMRIPVPIWPMSMKIVA